MPAIMYEKHEMRQTHSRSCAVRAQELEQEDGWDIDWFPVNRTIKELIDENEESWFDRETTLQNLRKTLCVVCTERPPILYGDCCGRQVLCWPCHRDLNAQGYHSCPLCRTEYALFIQNQDFQNLVEFYSDIFLLLLLLLLFLLLLLRTINTYIHFILYNYDNIVTIHNHHRLVF